MPTFNYYTITGHGDPNEPEFGERTAALYAAANHLKRWTLAHKEIYLSDPRWTVAAKRKTVLRWLLTDV